MGFLRKFGRKAQTIPPFCSVIVPAAGSASRMEGTDKVLLELQGVPVVIRTLQELNDCPLVHEIIVVTREDLIVPVGKLCGDYNITKAVKVIRGGKERSHSVLAGVKEVHSDAQLIAIHDGARPFVTQKLLEQVLTKGAKTGAAAPGVAVVDTIKRVENGLVVETVDRATLVAVQTPQVFEAGLIKAALEEAVSKEILVTDDCSAVERLGMKVSITPGDYENIKITTPKDVCVAEGILSSREGRI